VTKKVIDRRLRAYLKKSKQAPVTDQFFLKGWGLQLEVSLPMTWENKILQFAIRVVSTHSTITTHF